MIDKKKIDKKIIGDNRTGLGRWMYKMCPVDIDDCMPTQCPMGFNGQDGPAWQPSETEESKQAALPKDSLPVSGAVNETVTRAN